VTAAKSRQRRVERRAAERASLREQTLTRFGAAADERTGTDRRQPADPATLDARMRAAGITQDRRRGDRRR